MPALSVGVSGATAAAPGATMTIRLERARLQRGYCPALRGNLFGRGGLNDAAAHGGRMASSRFCDCQRHPGEGRCKCHGTELLCTKIRLTNKRGAHLTNPKRKPVDLVQRTTPALTSVQRLIGQLTVFLAAVSRQAQSFHRLADSCKESRYPA